MRPDWTIHIREVATLLLFALLMVASGVQVALSAEKPFRVSLDDVESSVARQLESEGAGGMIKALVISRQNRTLYSSNSPVDFSIDSLDFNARSLRWTAHLVIYAGGELEETLSLNGRYESQVEIPVLANRMHRDDIIEEVDIAWITYPEHRMRKDTVLSDEGLIGKSPRRVISKNRPIRKNELENPAIMKRGALIQVFFENPSIEIRTIGEAMDDAAMGDIIRVKNSDSNIVIQATVTGPNSAQVNRLAQLPERLASAR